LVSAGGRASDVCCQYCNCALLIVYSRPD
jgi:hypothetical protein